MKLTPDDFTHPEDRAALDKLRAIPLFPACVKAFMKFMPERQLHGLNMAQKIRLTPRQLPKIYRHLPPACKALEIEEPEFYLELDPQPNAYTYGDKRVFVTVTSGLIDALEDDEIYAVIAHECGHIACQHVMYRTMTSFLIRLGERIFGPLSVLSIPVQVALLYWFRRSELSADRALPIDKRLKRNVFGCRANCLEHGWKNFVSIDQRRDLVASQNGWRKQVSH